MATKPAPGPVGAEAPGQLMPGYLAQMHSEYSQFIAVTTLTWQGVPCYAEGAAVAASHPGVTGWLEAGLIRPVVQE